VAEAAFDARIEVLVVDDQADALRLLEIELTAAGLRVRTADSGEAALAAIKSLRPDAVLLDVKMGGMDGFETCQCIREIDEDLPIVFTTGLGETEHIVRGFEVGGTDYVTKPVSAAEVVARLMTHTRISRMVRATREAVDALELPMLAVGSGRLLWLNQSARSLLQRVLPPHEPLNEDSELPVSLKPIAAAGALPCVLSWPALTLRADAVSEADAAVTVVSLVVVHEGPAQPAWATPRLTSRETEVLLWVARGKTNRDIADILGMSPRTVNKHLEHVFEKLGVETRTAAAAAAQRLQIGQDD
jgi:DNA-binding NarL/FixJ family response regulator